MRARDITSHAQARKQQRGISDLQVRLLMVFGEDHYQKGGSVITFIPDRMLTQLRAAIDRMHAVALVKADSDVGVTLMHMTQPIRRTDYVS